MAGKIWKIQKLKTMFASNKIMEESINID